MGYEPDDGQRRNAPGVLIGVAGIIVLLVGIIVLMMSLGPATSESSDISRYAELLGVVRSGLPAEASAFMPAGLPAGTTHQDMYYRSGDRGKTQLIILRCQGTAEFIAGLQHLTDGVAREPEGIAGGPPRVKIAEWTEVEQSADEDKGLPSEFEIYKLYDKGTDDGTEWKTWATGGIAIRRADRVVIFWLKRHLVLRK